MTSQPPAPSVFLVPGRLFRGLIDLLLPPRCLACGTVVSAPGTLCPACWGRVRFLGPPCCACCGHPFEIGLGPDALCPACLRERPRYGRARAVFLYDEGSRALILRFKHADHTGSARYFARWMARAGSELIENADLLVPVPLHRWRLLARRYNQSALLAHALSRLCGVPVAADALTRRRDTPSQGKGGRDWRRRNVRGAFAVQRPDMIAGRRILLIDDVQTSGATLEECARVLLDSGAGSVDVLTLARAERD